MTRSIALLGSTGSIGRQTLEVARELGLSVAALTANKSVDLIEQQAREFCPRLAVLYDEDAARELRARLSDTNTQVLSGMEGLLAAATADDADTVVTAVMGMIGLQPTLAAIEKKKRIALANKETLVCAGELVVDAAEKYGARYFLSKPCKLKMIAERVGDIITAERVTRGTRYLSANVEALVTSMIHDVGVPAHVKGYQYLREAIMMAVDDKDVMRAITKVLYPQVARKFHSTSSRVERAIRHAIELAWERGDEETLRKFFGYTISNARGKPTNAEFIALFADKIQLQLKASQTR